MPATNATVIKKKTTTATTQPKTAATTTQPTTRATTLVSQATQNPNVQQAANAQNQSQAATGTGIFNWQLPNIVPSLDQFLGLPAVIDWQDIGIRVSLVVVGVVLVILVGWSIVRGNQSTTVNVQAPAQQSGTAEAEEAAEVAA